jgi:hypothetical protein
MRLPGSQLATDPPVGGLASNQQRMTVKPFLSDIKTIRQRARQYLRDGAITASYMPDRDTFSSSSIKH